MMINFIHILNPTFLMNYFFNKLLISLCISCVCLASSYAGDILISSPQTTTQTFDSNNQQISLSGAGSISTSGSSAIVDSSHTSISISLNAIAASVASSGSAFSAIALSGTSSMTGPGINLLGTITSNAVGNVGTISFTENASTPSITLNGINSSITNTASGDAEAIHYSNSSTGTLNLTNAGTISVNNTSAGSIAIDFSEAAAGLLNLNNNGIISATTAILVRSGFANIYNNGGSISGAINLGSGAGSYIALDAGGTITGNVTMGDSSQFLSITGSSNFIGNIDGAGKLRVLSGNVTLGGNIGSLTPITELTINSVGASLDASTYSINAIATTLSTSTSLMLGTGSFTSVVDGNSPSSGLVFLNGNNTFVSGVKFGSTNGIEALNILDGATITDNDSIKAVTVSIGFGGSGATFNLGANKSIIGNVVTGSNSTLGLNDNSSVKGSITGAGTISTNGAVTLGDLGQMISVSGLNIISGTTSIENDVIIDQTNVIGTLNLANANITITGNVIVNNSGIVNLGGITQNITGSFNTLRGGILEVGINSPSSAGNLIVAGVASMNANTVLHVDLGANTTAVGSSYTILTGGTSSIISQISDANINVDNRGSNKSGAFAFTTSVVGNSLVLNVVANTTPSFVDTPNQLGAYNAINNVNAPTGELATMQNYLASNTASDSQKTTALKSITPETDNSTNRVAFNNSTLIANILSERVNLVNNVSQSPGLASGEKVKTNSLWIQPFGSQVKQASTAQGDGYSANTGGIALGADTKISKNTIIGAGLNYASSNIKSKTGLQNTKIDSYQFNLYSGYTSKDYFINSAIGGVWNEYQSQRSIPVASVVARSSYAGQSYFARIEAGKQNRLGDNFILTPKIMITAAHNTIASYNENGAGTLNLSVKNNATDFLEGRAGFTLARYFVFNNQKLLPEISASYGYDFIGDAQKSTSNFVGQTTSFASEGSKVAQGSLKLGTGVQLFQGKSTILSLNYSYEHRSGYSGNYGSLRFRYSF